MTYLRSRIMRCSFIVLAATIVLSQAGTVLAQTAGGVGGGAGGAGGARAGGTGTGTGMGGAGAAGGSGGGSGILGSSGSGSGGGGSTSSSVDATNAFKNTYSNPAYMGRPNNTSNTSSTTSSGGLSTTQTVTATSNLGGFGQPSFGNTGSSGGSTGNGVFGGTATSGSRTAGGTGAGGARSGSGSGSSSTSGLSATRVSFTATVKFPTRDIPVRQLQTDLQGVIDRSAGLKDSSAIRVELVDNAVVLKGRVATEDDKKLAEGLIRLTPGVRAVRNELQVP